MFYYYISNNVGYSNDSFSDRSLATRRSYSDVKQIKAASGTLESIDHSFRLLGRPRARLSLRAFGPS